MEAPEIGDSEVIVADISGWLSYQVFDPDTASWVTTWSIRDIWGTQHIAHYTMTFALADGRRGSASRVYDEANAEVLLDMTDHVRECEAVHARLEQLASNHRYRVITWALGIGGNRYFLIVERRPCVWTPGGQPAPEWTPAECWRRDGIPKGYKTLRSGLIALWKHYEAKVKGSTGECYALLDLHTGEVIRESIIDIAKYLGATRALLRRKATVEMLKQAMA